MQLAAVNMAAAATAAGCGDVSKVLDLNLGLNHDRPSPSSPSIAPSSAASSMSKEEWRRQEEQLIQQMDPSFSGSLLCPVTPTWRKDRNNHSSRSDTFDTATNGPANASGSSSDGLHLVPPIGGPRGGGPGSDAGSAPPSPGASSVCSDRSDVSGRSAASSCRTPNMPLAAMLKQQQQMAAARSQASRAQHSYIGHGRGSGGSGGGVGSVSPLNPGSVNAGSIPPYNGYGGGYGGRPEVGFSPDRFPMGNSLGVGAGSPGASPSNPRILPSSRSASAASSLANDVLPAAASAAVAAASAGGLNRTPPSLRDGPYGGHVQHGAAAGAAYGLGAARGDAMGVGDGTAYCGGRGAPYRSAQNASSWHQQGFRGPVPGDPALSSSASSLFGAHGNGAPSASSLARMASADLHMRIPSPSSSNQGSPVHPSVLSAGASPLNPVAAARAGGGGFHGFATALVTGQTSPGGGGAMARGGGWSGSSHGYGIKEADLRETLLRSCGGAPADGDGIGSECGQRNSTLGEDLGASEAEAMCLNLEDVENMCADMELDRVSLSGIHIVPLPTLRMGRPTADAGTGMGAGVTEPNSEVVLYALEFSSSPFPTLPGDESMAKLFPLELRRAAEMGASMGAKAAEANRRSKQDGAGRGEGCGWYTVSTSAADRAEGRKGDREEETWVVDGDDLRDFII